MLANTCAGVLLCFSSYAFARSVSGSATATSNEPAICGITRAVPVAHHANTHHRVPPRIRHRFIAPV